jgi:hypothetical protein
MTPVHPFDHHSMGAIKNYIRVQADEDDDDGLLCRIVGKRRP